MTFSIAKFIPRGRTDLAIQRVDRLQREEAYDAGELANFAAQQLRGQALDSLPVHERHRWTERAAWFMRSLKVAFCTYAMEEATKNVQTVLLSGEAGGIAAGYPQMKPEKQRAIARVLAIAAIHTYNDILKGKTVIAPGAYLKLQVEGEHDHAS